MTTSESPKIEVTNFDDDDDDLDKELDSFIEENESKTENNKEEEEVQLTYDEQNEALIFRGGILLVQYRKGVPIL